MTKTHAYSLPVRVASFGASTAQGVGDDEQGGFIARLGLLLSTPSAPVEALNFGKGGNTTRDMLSRLETLNIPADTVIVISLGINDVARQNENNPKRVPLDEHRKNVDAIINALKKSATIIYMSQFPVDYLAKNLDPAYTESFVEAGLAVAAEHQLSSIALRPHLNQLTFPWQNLLASDGLHFNSAGHAFMAELLQKHILNR